MSVVTVPERIMKRMEQARLSAGDDKKQAKINQAYEGIKITVEIIEQIREIPGISGAHVQAIEWEHRIPEIIKEAGLFPRPALSQEVKEYATQG
jgi:methylenetetrahydrofolate reductase (NADPH)